MNKLQEIVEQIDALMEKYIKEIESIQKEKELLETTKGVVAVKIKDSSTWLKAVVKQLKE